MAISGDWVTPRLNSRPPYAPQLTTVPFFEKPVLVYWTAAAAMRVFGISETAARLPVVLAALLTTAAVVWAGRRQFGLRAGLLAGAVYASAPLTLLDARQMTTDGLLTLWLTGALLAIWEIYRPGQMPAEPWRQRLFAGLFWFFCALAILTKGVVGLLLPLLVVGVFLLLEAVQPSRSCAGLARSHTRQRLRALRPVGGLLLCLALAAPWHVAILRAGGRDANGRTFVQEYVVRQHVGRFRGLDRVHNAPPPTYALYFLVGFFPWSCFAIAAFRADRKIDAMPASPEERESPDSADLMKRARSFLLVWFWTVLLFFSAGSAKLPTYIAPAYPAAAILVGRWLDRLLAGRATHLSRMWRALFGGASIALAVAAALFCAALYGPRLGLPSAPVPVELIGLGRLFAAILLAFCALAWGCALLGASNAFWRGGVVAVYMLMIAALVGLGSTRGYTLAARLVQRPYQNAAAAALKDARAGVPIVFYHIVPRRPSMLYYAGYSPLELRDPPLLPLLRRSLQAPGAMADVITGRETRDRMVVPELKAAPELDWRTLEVFGPGDGGWVLLRVRRRSHASDPRDRVNPHHTP